MPEPRLSRGLGRPSAGLVLSGLVPAVVVGLVLALVLSPDEPPAASPSVQRQVRAELDSSLAPPAVEEMTGVPEPPRPPAGDPEPSSGPRPGIPTSIAVPAAGVLARIDSVGTSANGLTIPPPGRTGWYRDGPRPGEPGRALLVGHVDTRRGPAVFAGLRSLGPDDHITIRDRSGRAYGFRVVAVEQVAKSRFPRHDVYGATARRALVLVTCGGPFTPGRGYRDNVIVYARAD